MPAPIASPTCQPLRSVDLMRNRDIGPSWRATKNPRPKPMTAAFIVEYSSFSGDSRQVEQATWSDSLPEDQCPGHPAVRPERVVGYPSGQRESEPMVQTSRAAFGCGVEHQECPPELNRDSRGCTHQRRGDSTSAVARSGHELGHLRPMWLVRRHVEEERHRPREHVAFPRPEDDAFVTIGGGQRILPVGTRGTGVEWVHEAHRATARDHLDEDLAELCKGFRRSAQDGDLEFGHETESARTGTLANDPVDLDHTRGDGLLDPRDDLVEHLIQRGRGFDAEHALRLLHRGNPPLDVVLERRVADVPKGHVVAPDPVPDLLRQRQNGCRLAS